MTTILKTTLAQIPASQKALAIKTALAGMDRTAGAIIFTPHKETFYGNEHQELSQLSDPALGQVFDQYVRQKDIRHAQPEQALARLAKALTEAPGNLLRFIITESAAQVARPEQSVDLDAFCDGPSKPSPLSKRIRNSLKSLFNLEALKHFETGQWDMSKPVEQPAKSTWGFGLLTKLWPRSWGS